MTEQCTDSVLDCLQILYLAEININRVDELVNRLNDFSPSLVTVIIQMDVLDSAEASATERLRGL